MRLTLLIAMVAAVAGGSSISLLGTPLNGLAGSRSVSAAQAQLRPEEGAADAAGASDAAGVQALLDAGKLTEAETAANALMETAEKARGPEASEVADALELLIEARYWSGFIATGD